MLAAGGLEGVVVAVPAAAYRLIIAQCIEAGLPVFCEKPAGHSASELQNCGGFPGSVSRLRAVHTSWNSCAQPTAATCDRPVAAGASR